MTDALEYLLHGLYNLVSPQNDNLPQQIPPAFTTQVCAKYLILFSVVEFIKHLQHLHVYIEHMHQKCIQKTVARGWVKMSHIEMTQYNISTTQLHSSFLVSLNRVLKTLQCKMKAAYHDFIAIFKACGCLENWILLQHCLLHCPFILQNACFTALYPPECMLWWAFLSSTTYVIHTHSINLTLVFLQLL